MSAIEYLTKSLKAARQEKKLSQRALSLKTGIQQTQISRIESGQADLRVSTLVGLGASFSTVTQQTITPCNTDAHSPPAVPSSSPL
ncbi:MAG: helix-turn-helix transcriptional regulator [Desulfocapsa sp.]|nr:helix-turn-helix transcriptional regulator [Desulfocapsa sp.]